MDDGYPNIKIIQDHFQPSTPTANSIEKKDNSSSHVRTESSFKHRFRTRLWTRRKIRTATSMLNLLSLRGLPWRSGSDEEEKVELTASELESLRSEVSELEEREAHLRAQLENLDEVLRSARFSGYLYIRRRWAALPGEPPPIDDIDVDDWIPRFVVLQGSCIYFYLISTDLSPQDSTLLSEVVEVGALPSFTRQEQNWHGFYILTCQGLQYECSSFSSVQVASWLTALQTDCKLDRSSVTSNGLSETQVS